MTSNDKYAIIQSVDCTPATTAVSTAADETATDPAPTPTPTPAPVLPYGSAGTCGIDSPSSGTAAAAATAAVATPSVECVDQTATQIKQDELPFNATQQQKDMLEWHNKARTDPKSLVPELTTMLSHFGTGDDAKKYSVPGKTTILTNEGAPAV
jgi:hypothetical protein